MSSGPELGSEVGPQVPTRVSLLTHQTGLAPHSSSHTLGLKGSRSDTYYQQPENRFPEGHGFLQQVALSAGSILTRSLGRTPAPSANTGCRTPGKPGPSHGAGERCLAPAGMLPGAPSQGVVMQCRGLNSILGCSEWGGLTKCYWLMLEIYCHVIVKFRDFLMVRSIPGNRGTRLGPLLGDVTRDAGVTRGQ